MFLQPDRARPKITVITPSIRPEGLKVTFNTLREQTFQDFEWLTRMSLPGDKSDLCYQMNQAIREANGELIVFLQDYIEIGKDGLQRIWDRYQAEKAAYQYVCWTMPVGKKDMDNPGKVTWDWRSYGEEQEEITFERWEIDWGAAPRAAFAEEEFAEEYDAGFGWENVDLAYRLMKNGWKFKVDRYNEAEATDHDKMFVHPYKKRPNQDLWIVRKGLIDLAYDEGANSSLGTSQDAAVDSE
jgi:glycosyltransferase involved in cell wall biosynthesis